MRDRVGSADGRIDRVRLVAVLGVVWLALYAALTAVSRSRGATFAVDLAYLVPILAATALSVAAARAARGRTRRAWTVLAVSNASWAAGELIWVAYAHLGSGPPAVSVADIFYLSSYAIALPAILMGFGAANPLRHVRGLLDAALVALALGAVGWHVVLRPALPTTPGVAEVVAFLYPVLGVAIVTTVVSVGLAGHRFVPPWVLLAGAAFAVGGLTDAGYAYAFVVHTYDSDDWLNIGWQGAAVLLCLAAAAVLDRPDREAQVRRLDRDVSALPILAAAAAAICLVVSERLSDGGTGVDTLAIVVVLFAGLLVRQVVMTHDRTRLAAELSRALDEQERLATTDGLTGLYNRRHFQERLRSSVERARGPAAAASLLMIDIDRFKKVNDTFGHPAGDTALRAVADRIRAAVRPADAVARYGGEEFVCLLPAAEEEVALEVAEQIRRAIGGTPIPLGGGQVTLTASVGVATAGTRGRPPVDADALLLGADAALYRAKACGRNRVVIDSRLADLTLETDPALPPALVWLADAIDAKLSAQEHSTAVSRWGLLVAERLGLDAGVLRRVAAAGRLHDIGKVAVPDRILTTCDRLTDEQWRHLRRHPAEGARLLTELGARPDLAAIVVAHHERYDGGGYPHQLAAADIPIEARIIAVADAWAAMRADRPYAGALTVAQARRQIQEGRGSQFDPVVADTFLTMVDEGMIDDPAPLQATPRQPENAGSPVDRT